MCVEMTKSPMAVYVLCDGAVVTVNGVRMIFTASAAFGDSVYFTTADSDMAGYDKREAEESAKLDKDDPHYDFIVKHAPAAYYGEYIKHVRNAEYGASLFTRAEFSQMFLSGKFVIA